MINASFIYNSANELVKNADTRNPIIIASELDVKVKYSNIFNEDLLGLYLHLGETPVILLNDNVNEHIKKMACAHELGHHILHPEIISDRFVYEIEMSNPKNNTEYEANAFASHILIDDDDLFSLLEERKTIQEISKILKVNYNLTLIKLQEFNRMGMNINIPCPADSFFFKNPETLIKNDF